MECEPFADNHHEEEEEEAEGNLPPGTAISSKKRPFELLCRSVSSEDPTKIKRPRHNDDDRSSDSAPEDTSMECEPFADNHHEEEEEAEEFVTITGGKYAGRQCIIVKHLARRVRIQLVDSGLVTCISRRSLGLDEVKTVWHANPRRSARIKAMMEASRSDQTSKLPQ